MRTPSVHELTEEYERLLKQTQASDRLPSAAAAVARDGEIVWASAIGLADCDAAERTSGEHQYRTGSVTKTFTAVAVMQLRDAGAFDLDDRIDRHLEGVARTPTIRALLTHMSGLQQEPPGVTWEPFRHPSAPEVAARVGAQEQALAPGREWHYSNLAFMLLGELVASASGSTYRRYVRERILTPLGLTRTSFEPVAPTAIGYMVDAYQDRVRPEPSESNGRDDYEAGAALWSTPTDLCRWGAFIADPDPAVLAPESVQEMATVHAMSDPRGWTQAWGLGLSLIRYDDVIVAAHGGSMPGFRAGFVVSRDHRVAASFMTNSRVAQPIPFSSQLVRKTLALESASTEEWAPSPPVPDELAGALGRWWTEGSELVFSWRRGRLEARTAGDSPDAEPAVFERIGRDHFRTAAGPRRGERLDIERTDAGEIVALRWAHYPCTRDQRTAAPPPPH